MRLGRWRIAAEEPHRSALARGDLVLIYLGPPERQFVGRAELASVPVEWTASEADARLGESPSEALLAQVEEWDPPVPMADVLSHIDRSENARGEFDTGVVRITAGEYETALAVAARRATSDR
jgi:hypothetical protein